MVIGRADGPNKRLDKGCATTIQSQFAQMMPQTGGTQSQRPQPTDRLAHWRLAPYSFVFGPPNCRRRLRQAAGERLLLVWAQCARRR